MTLEIHFQNDIHVIEGNDDLDVLDFAIEYLIDQRSRLEKIGTGKPGIKIYEKPLKGVK